MGMPTKHCATIALDHCWVCKARFIGSGGTAIKEEHHVIPRAFGGTDGPTVSLCDGHHGKLHRIAVCLKSGKPYFEILKGEDKEAVQKLLYLANSVYNAELATRNDPNKAAHAMLTLNAYHKQMIDSLKKVYPRSKSRESILLIALESLYKKHFMMK